MPLRFFLLARALLLAASLAASASAQDVDGAGEGAATAADGTPLTAEEVERARNHFMAGTAYYEDGRWENAAREFQEAYRITGHPDVLYNLGQAYDRMDRRQEAVEAYRGYLAQSETAPDRDRVERRIRELEQLSRLDGDEPPGGDQARDATGPHAGDGVTEPPPVAQRGNRFGLLPWASVGAGAALALGAAITGALALATHGDLEDACGADRLCPPERQDDIDSGRALATWSTVLTIGAVLGVGAGITLLVIGAPDEETTPDATVELTGGPTPVGAGARLTF